jgi:hypothetical protein
MKINNQNYETYFLSYIDNELSADEKKEVELFIKEDSKYATELAILSNTVLEPISIEYEDKALLYRYEELEASLPKTFKQNLYRREAPIVKGFFTNTRMRSISAVAAIFLLLVGYKFISNKTEVINNTIVATNQGARESLAKVQVSNTFATNTLNAKKLNIFTNSNNLSGRFVNTSSKAQVTIAMPTNALSEPTLPLATSLYQQDQHINDLVALSDINTIENADKAVSALASYEPSSVKEAKAEAAEDFDNINTDNPDRVVYIANLEIDGDKLRGFTRRVSALLKRNKTEKEKEK